MKKLVLIVFISILTGRGFCQSNLKTADSANRTAAVPASSYKVSFDYIFKRNFDGSFSPNFTVQVNGETMGAGVPFYRGTSFGGINVGAYEGHSLMIDTIKNVVLIRKFL
jgi:hypothetical protein